jgi:hypothetical protein
MDIIIGTHSVGKTTLLKEIDKTHPELYTSDGFSRPLQESLKGLEPVYIQKVLNELTLWRWKQDIEKKNCIFGRSIIDCIVYSRILFPDLQVRSLVKELETSRKQVRNYFYLPIEFELQKDGIRPEDIAFQKQVDEDFYDLMARYNLDAVTLTGSVEERLEKFNKYV